MASLITADPQILGGKPIIQGTRITVDFILELYAAGVSREEILMDYPHLTPEAISACLTFAAPAASVPARPQVGVNSRNPHRTGGERGWKDSPPTS